MQKNKRKSQIDFEKSVDASPAILWITEADGACSYLSQQWYQVTGQTEDEGLGYGYGWLNATHPDDKKRTEQIFNESNAKQISFSTVYRLRTVTHGYRWVIDAANPRFDCEGNYLGYAGTVLDIHESVQQTKELAQAKIAAEHANRLKSAFLANMSHEIRTPLGAILGFTELMKDSTSYQERSEFAQIINRNGKALTKIIDDILDLSKVEAGRLELEKLSFNLPLLIKEVMDLFNDIAEKKGLILTSGMSASLPCWIKSDPTRIRQILINLIGNAVKFTKAGYVRVILKALRSENQLTHVQFSIQDTGVGLSNDQIKKLFEPFSQADNSTTRKFGGSGLGLALSKRLAQALEGDVRIVQSSPGKGSTFVATVSALEGQDPSILSPVFESIEVSSQSQGIKVLLVEDSLDNQILVKRILMKSGMHVEVAHNGLEGIKKATDHDFDVVLMDMQMPVLDGYTATRTLRQSGYTKPIIALTAHAMADEKKLTQISGCDEHLTKPLDSQLLTNTIIRLSGSSL